MNSVVKTIGCSTTNHSFIPYTHIKYCSTHLFGIVLLRHCFSCWVLVLIAYRHNYLCVHILTLQAVATLNQLFVPRQYPWVGPWPCHLIIVIVLCVVVPRQYSVVTPPRGIPRPRWVDHCVTTRVQSQHPWHVPPPPSSSLIVSETRNVEEVTVARHTSPSSYCGLPCRRIQ